MVQMLVRPGDEDVNLQRAGELIGRAAKAGALLAVLPEALNLGWTDTSALARADAIPCGHTCTALSDIARRHSIYLCAGLVERAGDALYNAAVLFDPSGRLLLHHRKINELEMAHSIYRQGSTLSVVSTPLGTLGIMICADAFVPGQSIARALCHQGADIILSPCSWAVPADHDNRLAPYGALWRDNYRPVARDFGVWIMGVSNVGWITSGPWQGRKCIGCSLTIGPEGEEICGDYGPEAEQILYADLGVTEARRELRKRCNVAG